MTKKTSNDWLKEIEKEIGGRADIVPDGWMTANQIKDVMDMTIGEAEVFIRRAIDKGLMKKNQFRINSGGGTRLVWHYHKSEK